MNEHDVEYREVSWAQVAPDTYAGEECDDIRHRWCAESAGDMGAEHLGNLIELAADTFPPGTKLTISVPECPGCHESSDIHYPVHKVRELGEGDKYPEYLCQCGFNWKQWTMEQFS